MPSSNKYARKLAKEAEYSRLAKSARKLGLVDYNPKSLTPGQKSNLTKLYDKNRELLDSPDKYFKRRVSKDSQKLLKETGHKVIKGKVFLQKQGDKTVSVRKTSSGNVKISRIAKDGKTRRDRVTTLHKDPLHIFKEIDRLEKRLKKIGISGEGDLGPYQSITAKFGDKAPFGQSFDSLSAFRKYLEKFNAEKLRYLTLVTYQDDEESENEID